jgi:phage terminase large subunit
MTTSKAEERSRREEIGPETLFAVLGADLADAARELGAGDRRWAFPLTRYQKKPEAFCREVLGIELMPEQAEILRAVVDAPRVAVAGGRKVGKDFVTSAIGCWFFACFPGARVRFTAVTDEQVKVVFWRELVAMVRGAGRCLACKRADPSGPRPCPHSAVLAEPDEIPVLARTGIKKSDGRELVGYTLGEAAAGRGISGGYQLDIIDEASDVDDDRIETIDGNHLGCVVGRTILLSNPSRTSGQFYRAFHEEKKLWRTFYRSSLEIAKKYGGKIPGIARLDQVEEFIEKHGADSDLVMVHIHGRFPETSEGKVFPIHMILAAQSRHGKTPAAGPLYLGIDVAGETGSGDDSAFAIRRGSLCLEVLTRRALSPEQHLSEALRIIAQHPSEDPTELPVVVVDIGGDPGSKVRGVFAAYMQTVWSAPPFRVVYVDASRKGIKYQRNAPAFDRVRDELVANMADWLRAGGAIPKDPRLAHELNEYRWLEQPLGSASKLIDKRKMRETLGGQSPDMADALALACWAQRHWAPPTAETPATMAEAPAPRDMQDANAVFYEDPAAPAEDANDPWWPKG